MYAAERLWRRNRKAAVATMLALLEELRRDIPTVPKSGLAC